MDIALRAPEPEDLDFLYWLENLPEVRCISWGDAPVSRHLLWEYLQSYTPDISRDRQLRLIIEKAEKPVGTIDLSDYDPTNSRAMVGIAISPENRGCGVGKNALDKLIMFCRQSLCLHQIYAIVSIENTVSVKLFKTFGFKVTGCLRSWIKQGPRYIDALTMQLILE